MPKIGNKPINSLVSGYYLFQKAKLIAFHRGTVDIKKDNPKLQYWAGIIGAAAGAVVGGLTKDSEKGFQTVAHTIYAPLAFKVFIYFKKILEKTYSSSQQKQDKSDKNVKLTNKEKLEKAYKTIGVSPQASDKEIKKAWRNLNLKNHPDKSPNDITERTMKTAEINDAYDEIMISRGKKKMPDIRKQK